MVVKDTTETKHVLIDDSMKYISSFYEANQTLNNTKSNDKNFRAKLLDSQESHLKSLMSIGREKLKELKELKGDKNVEYCDQKLFLDPIAFDESSERTFCYLKNCISNQEEFLSELDHQYMLVNYMITFELADVYIQDLSTEKKLNVGDGLNSISGDNAISRVVNTEDDKDDNLINKGYGIGSKNNESINNDDCYFSTENFKHDKSINDDSCFDENAGNYNYFSKHNKNNEYVSNECIDKEDILTEANYIDNDKHTNDNLNDGSFPLNFYDI